MTRYLIYKPLTFPPYLCPRVPSK